MIIVEIKSEEEMLLIINEAEMANNSISDILFTKDKDK